MASNPVVISPVVCLSPVPSREIAATTEATLLEKPVVVVGQTTAEVAIHQASAYWQTLCQTDSSNSSKKATALGAILTEPSETETDDVTEEVSTSITQTWTDQAIKCFLTGANCSRCIIPRSGYAFQCQMNKVVPVLVQQLQVPDTNRVERLLALVHD